MKRISTYFIFGLSLTVATLFGEIYPAHQFADITKYAQPDSLILLDIDDTILVPVQTLGTDVWFQDRLNFHHKFEADPVIALDKALAEWEAIRHLTQMKLVEESTAKTISDLQEKHTVMGLTTQGLALTTRTVNQLRGHHIDLSMTAPSKEDFYFINRHGVLYRDGILFTSGTPKGPALVKLFALMNIAPKHVLFINDKLTHLKDVEESLEKAGIPFTGLRYTSSDERVAAYNADLADVQWRYSSFEYILTDEEAALILQTVKGE